MATALHRLEDFAIDTEPTRQHMKNYWILGGYFTAALSQCNFCCSAIKDLLAVLLCFRTESGNRVTYSSCYSLKHMSIQAVCLSLFLSFSLYLLMLSSLPSLFTRVPCAGLSAVALSWLSVSHLPDVLHLDLPPPRVTASSFSLYLPPVCLHPSVIHVNRVLASFFFASCMFL